MKDSRSVFRALIVLIPAFAITAVMVAQSGCGGGSSSSPSASPTPTPQTGNLQVGFIGAPLSNFNRLGLNAVFVRLNPAATASVAADNPDWVAIPAAAGPGVSGSAIQIDVTGLGQEARMFNSAEIPQQTYHHVEVDLNLSAPGTLIPICLAQLGAAFEGCVPYDFNLGPNTQLSFFSPSGINVTSGTQTLLLQLSVPSSGVSQPSGPGGSFSITPQLSQVTNLGDYLGLVTGKVIAGSFIQPSGLTVVAEVSGTDTGVTAVPVNSDGTLSIRVPAPANQPSASTLYDFYVFGETGVPQAIQGIPVSVGSPVALPTAFPINASTISASVTGSILDSSGNGIGGAVVDLLEPPLNKPGVDCASTPEDCVAVSTVSSADASGDYSISGVPFSSQTSPAYAVRVTKAGYDTVLSSVTGPPASSPKSTGSTTNATCSGSINSSNCSFQLTNGTISGTVGIDVPPPSGFAEQFIVLAELPGTGTIVSSSQIFQIPPGNFSINVPTNPGVYDLVVVPLDKFNGPYTGSPIPNPTHQYLTMGSVPVNTSGVSMGTLNCVGQASLTGSAPGADANTTIRLFKSGPGPGGSPTPVQVMETSVELPSSSNPGPFSFCLPPDNYTVQRFENGSPVSSPTAIAVAPPSPAASPSPCPVCTNASGQCPGLCSNTSLGSLN